MNELKTIINDSSSPQETPSPEIPHIEERMEEDEFRPKRFQYQRTPRQNKGKIRLVFGIIVIFIVMYMLIYGYPIWHAKISLQEQLYTYKAGVDYWTLLTLNYWSTSFILNKTGLIGAFIGAIIFSIPPETTLLSVLGTKFGWGRPSKKKALLLNWTFGFVIFYIFGQAIDTSYFAITMYMIEQGTLSVTSLDYLNAMKIISDPAAVSMIDIYFYSSVVYPVVLFIFVMLILRLGLAIVENTYLVKNPLKVAGSVMAFIGIIFGINYFEYPLHSVDGLILIRSPSVLIGFIGFSVLGMLLSIYGTKKANRHEYIVAPALLKKIGITVGALIIIILVPTMISIPTAISIDSGSESWIQNRWQVQIQREISWTQQTSGINLFNRTTIDEYINDVQVSDLDLVESIRQYDKKSAALRMNARIGTTYETLADSDIVFINDGATQAEYWVAPKTLNTQASEVTESAIKRHTEVYDHVEGFLALDTSTGELVPDNQFESIFGVKSDYPIFFGEAQDTSLTGDRTTADSSTGIYYEDESLVDVIDYIDAFEDDILLNSGWIGSNSTNKYIYSGAPDGNLTGMEAFWFTLDMGLTQNALNNSRKDFLVNRNIYNRVMSILLPGMVLDPDPYLVFDSVNKKMYYAYSVATQIEIGGFAKSPLYRFLGVVLTDVTNGELTFIKNPSLASSVTDSALYPIYKLYIDSYPWAPVPDWLKDQLRYPEAVWEAQLFYDYTFHVTNSQNWYNSNDFYERPEGGDAFYIETDLGDGMEFCGIDTVQFVGRDAYSLAGFYLVRHGDHFGETIFYRADLQSGVNLLGPSTALDAFNSTATNSLFSIQQKRFGNILLYPIGGSLYYYIPTYSSSGNLEELRLSGFVNAFNKTVAWGITASDAYLALNLTQGEAKAQNVSLTVSGPSSVIYDPVNWAEFRAVVEMIDTNNTIANRTFTMNLTIYHETGADVKVFNNFALNSTFAWGNGNTGYNYTVMNPYTFAPGEGKIITIKLMKNPTSAPSVSLWYKFTLIENNEIVASTALRTFTVINEENP